ncbi:hypothetical protein INS49_014217 [Diaporthe citri]|uniref:uncharacterized protein n=1 Tax=Diaporthe citri TaxID=83186 RepID=UPI001C8003EE|nr:uncharacterized protein INS49_014217 [Diaporthe citri]KAG6358333.1 hypothetical protein INS49_014217 [Diaporthe citri]
MVSWMQIVFWLTIANIGLIVTLCLSSRWVRTRRLTGIWAKVDMVGVTRGNQASFRIPIRNSMFSTQQLASKGYQDFSKALDRPFALPMPCVPSGAVLVLPPSLLPLLTRPDKTSEGEWTNSPGMVESTACDQKSSLEYSLLPKDVYGALSHLRQFLIEHVSLKNKGDYEKAVTILEVTVVQIAHAGVDVEVGAILLLAFFLPESVVSDIKDHKLQALLILAYYAVFVHALDKVDWFLRGWGRELLKDINDQIEVQKPCRDLLD